MIEFPMVVEFNLDIPVVPANLGQKHPSCKWKELRLKHPSAYREDFSGKNCVLITGNTPARNFVGFDFDTYGNEAAIAEARSKINERFGPLPWEEAYIQSTPSGGMHYIFQAPKGVVIKSTTDLLDDKDLCVDVRAEGGLLVLAPSQTVSKQDGVMKTYVHINRVPLSDAAVLNSTACEKLTAQNQQVTVVATTPQPVLVPCAPPTAQVTAQLTQWVEMVMSRCLSNLAMATEGSRNTQLNAQSFILGRLVGTGLLPLEEAEAFLKNAATSLGLTQSEIDSTVSSGLVAGFKLPIPLSKELSCIPEWDALIEQTSIWATPKPLGAPLLPVLTLDEDMLPKDMYHYAAYKALKLDNAPIEFIAIPLIIAYAATLGTTHVLRPKALDFDWKETPVLWGGLVAPPSAKKSPCLSVGSKPAAKIQKHLTKKFKEEMKKAKVRKKLLEKRAKQLEEQAHEAFASENEEEATQLLTQSEELRDQIKMPVERKIIINDATIEAIGVRLSGTRDGILVLRDELSGLLVDFKDERSAARPFFLEAYNGGNEFITERISREQVHIPRLAVWVVGGIQPDKLMPFLHARKHNGDNDGFLERLQLLVMPDIPEGKYLDQRVADQEKELFNRVDDAFLRAGTIGFNEKGHSHEVRFDIFAQVLWAEWVQEQHDKIKTVDIDMQSVLGKHIGLCARLALTFHMFEEGSASKQIEKVTLEMAIRFISFLESHQYRIFSSCENTALHDLLKLFLTKLGGLPNPFTLSDVSDKKWSSFGKDNRDTVLENLCNLGYLFRVQSRSKHGRPTILYYKHPDYCGL
ncbi:DUF3987 domain-containing protein [Vibrio parahaemolyticus]|nr:DUF3987 domain-containing protein [Vibrio parahaemolyticus]HCG9703130.1 DUF3987 domain-containing protein [Vibrio parahaemolyticus]